MNLITIPVVFFGSFLLTAAITFLFLCCKDIAENIKHRRHEKLHNDLMDYFDSKYGSIDDFLKKIEPVRRSADRTVDLCLEKHIEVECDGVNKDYVINAAREFNLKVVNEEDTPCSFGEGFISKIMFERDLLEAV